MKVDRWLLRPRVPAGLGAAVLACIALFQLPWSPAASAHFIALTGAPPFDERPAGYALSGVLAAFRQLGATGLADYEAYRAVDIVFPWLLCALVAAVMLRLDAARATMWPWLARGPTRPRMRSSTRSSPPATTSRPSSCNGPAPPRSSSSSSTR